MSDTKWTDEQISAIEVKGGSVIVSAAAGSGKTTVLIERLKRIIVDEENPTFADRIVLVTFTNEAAAQMKQRLNETLEQALSNDKKNLHILKQMELLPKAKISTMTSFFFDLIRDNIGSLPIDPGFRIVEEQEEELIIVKALDELIDECLSEKDERREEISALIDFISPNKKSIDNFVDMIIKFRRKLMSQPFCEEYIEKCAKAYDCDINDNFMYKAHLQSASNIAKAVKEKVIKFKAGIIDYAQENHITTKKRVNESNYLIGLLEAIERDYNNGFKVSFTEMEDGVKVFANWSKLTPKKDIDEERVEELKKLRDNIKNIVVNDIATIYGDNSNEEEDLKINAKYCAILSKFMIDLDDKIKEEKKRKNVLGFSDAERYTIQLLCEKNGDVITPSKLAKELADYYDIILIDEFQDSSKNQSLIFNMISKNGESDKAGTNLFAVGDIKQSIYRFNNADPSIFLDRLNKSVPASEAKDNEPRNVLLKKNFRSSQGVVDFVNDIFATIMNEEVGGFEYDESHMLVKGSSIDEPFETELIYGEVTIGDNAKVYDEVLSEAQAVARRIKLLIREKQITRLSDICLLFRNKKNIPIYLAALKEHGVAASDRNDDNLLETREICGLMNLVKVIDNASSDIALASALMSDMFMFTAEDMTELALQEGTTLYSKLLASVGIEQLEYTSIGLYNKVKKFLDVFDDIRIYAASSTIESLLRYICDRTDLMQIVSVYPDRALRKANILLFIRYAATYDNTSGLGVDGFIRHINTLREKKQSIDSAVLTDGVEDAVILMTMHKSKGLEFPYVFVCNTLKKFNLKDMQTNLIYNSKNGIAFRITNIERFTEYKSFPYEFISKACKKDLLDEELMLLYVALTRAKNKLFISYPAMDYLPQLCKLPIDEPSKAMKMYDWINYALASFDFSRDDENIYYENGGHIVKTLGPLNEMDMSDSTEDDTSDDDEITTNDSIKSALLEKLEKNRSYSMIHAQTPAKLVVSKIAKSNNVTKLNKPTISENRYSRTSEIEVKIPRGMSAADVGTAVHAFMEAANLKEIANSDDMTSAIKKEAKRLADSGKISKAQEKCAVPSVIIPFFNTTLWKRMEKSLEIHREKKFLVKISNLHLDESAFSVYNDTIGVLQGVADCLFKDNDGYVLVDYKTDHNKSEGTLASLYQKQLYLYAKAFSVILGEEVKEAYLYSFTLGKEIPVDITTLGG